MAATPVPNGAIGLVTAALMILLVGLGGCSPGAPDPSAGVSSPGGGGFDATLSSELLAMAEADQAERTGRSTANGDGERATRLGEILDKHGWPTPELVGDKAVSAAWLIAQHADHDIEFQKRALGLMRPAVEAGDADRSELAYLEDRVAVNTGQPQTYGTQVRCIDGRAQPATPIVEPESVDERRAAVGLDPLADYLALLESECAAS